MERDCIVDMGTFLFVAVGGDARIQTSFGCMGKWMDRPDKCPKLVCSTRSTRTLVVSLGRPGSGTLHV